MKSLKNLESFRLQKNQLTSVFGGAQEYYCYAHTGFSFYSDEDHTGSPSESGDPINCVPVVTVSARRR